MENSTILRDIAELDIKAPISVSISFDDDDLGDTPIKTEIETDYYQEESEVITISDFFTAPQTNPEVKSETATNEQNDEFIEQSTHQPESLRNSLSLYINDDRSRKRKSENVEMFDSKKNKVISDSMDNNNVHVEHTSQTFSHNNAPNLTPSENPIKDLVGTTNDSNESDINLGLSGLQQMDVNKIDAYITNCLKTLSENMLHIMRAYGAYKRQQISNEHYIKIKYYCFHRSYKIILTILIPEENNVKLLNAFLNETVHCAQKVSDFTYGYEDYTNLLNEMFIWTKKKQELTQQKNISDVSNEVCKQSTSMYNSVTVPSKDNIIPPQDKGKDKRQFSGSNTNTSEKICTFSTGPPERAVSINIVPNLNKTLQVQNSGNTNQPLSKASDINLANEYLPRFAGNSKNPVPQSLQSTVLKTPTQVASHVQKYPISNYGTLPQQTKSHPTNLKSMLENPTLLSYLTQPIQSQRPPPWAQCGHSQNFEPGTSIPPPPPYDPFWRLQGQSNLQQPIQPQYNPTVQTLSPQVQFQQVQYLQHQSGSQYSHKPQEYSQQQRPPVIQYPSNQERHLQVSHQTNKQPSQQGSQQFNQQPNSTANDNWPSMMDLLSTPQPNVGNESLAGQWPAKNQQLNQQIQPTVAHPTEWHQGLNAIYQAAQVPSHTQKGSPRSASTDSGIISPLNFNMSLDQTMQTVPQDPETSLPMIVHVTSLSDKAAFVELGKCVVCEKSTKQMCMGCWKVYYCDHQCQSSDWATHAPHCKPQNKYL